MLVATLDELVVHLRRRIGGADLVDVGVGVLLGPFKTAVGRVSQDAPAVFDSQFGQNIGCIGIAAGRQMAEHVQGAFFAGEFDELIRCILAAAVSKTAELVEILSFCGEFDELSDGVGVAMGRSFPQVREFRASHGASRPFRRPGTRFDPHV